MPHIDDPRKTFTAGADLSPYRLCKLSNGTLVPMTATATDRPIGVNSQLFMSGSDATVKMLTSDGTVEIEASGPITYGSDVYAAASGKIQTLPGTTGTYRRIGTALGVATGAGAIVEVLPDDFNSTKAVA